MRRPIVAYDLETTNIAEGTPEPRYITAYGPGIRISEPLSGLSDLCRVLTERLLTFDRRNTRFVAWNGNNFDALFVGRALLLDERYQVHPWLTRGGTLRGAGITASFDGEHTTRWYLSDGIAISGLAGTSLKAFLQSYAPDYAKDNRESFSERGFDANNPSDVHYAERDAEGLYHGMMRLEQIVHSLTGGWLENTIGKLGILYLQSKLPPDTLIWKMPHSAQTPVRAAMRGGYCWLSEQYQGPTWKYDINQAYAGAMRDARLPSGRCYHSLSDESDVGFVYARVERSERTRVPFYIGDGRFSDGYAADVWITTIERDFLRQTGWSVDVAEGWYWTDSFDLSEMVNELETLRMTCDGGPKGPIGTMVKMIGNNAYGKTAEQRDGINLIFAAAQPDGYNAYRAEDSQWDNVWFAVEEPADEPYQRLQIAATITAYVRCQIMRAAYLDPDNFLYADTDSVSFKRPAALPVHPSKYGLFKLESDGSEHTFVGKKVYASPDGVHAKGLRVRRRDDEPVVTHADMAGWLAGQIPVQSQLQRQSARKVFSGQPMFRRLQRHGTDVSNLQSARLVDGRFIPKGGGDDGAAVAT